MSTGQRLRSALAAAVVVGAGGALAQPIGVAELQRLLQSAPKGAVRFQETRESPWLPAPMESSGRMVASAGLLEKTVEQPRRETLRILPDRLELLVPGAGTPRQVLFSDAPAVAVLAGALRQVMDGDLQALEKDYRLVPGGDEGRWTLQLAPRSVETARFLKQIELQGSGAQLRVIVILESRGERTVTRLSPEP